MHEYFFKSPDLIFWFLVNESLGVVSTMGDSAFREYVKNTYNAGLISEGIRFTGLRFSDPAPLTVLMLKASSYDTSC